MAQLDAERIAAAALELIDERGVEGFSIRAVAKSLGVTPMALYHHVRDKAALAEMVVEAALSEHVLDAPTGDWRQDLWNLARYMRAITLGHPAVAGIRRTFEVWSPQSHRTAARWMTHWLESGLTRDDAVLAAATSAAAMTGLVAEEARQQDSDLPRQRPELPELPDADLLLLSHVDADRRFALGFDAIIDGLLANLGKSPG